MKASKKIVAGLLAAVTMVVGVTIVPEEAKAAGTAVDVKTSIEYVETEYQTYSDAWGQQDKIPTKEGYLFGGWYEEVTGDTVIKTKDQVSEGTNVFAKFVPSYVMSVKAQNYSTTKDTDATDDKTDTRLVSSVDSQAYANVGFEIIDMERGSVIPSDSFNTVYSKLQVIKDGDTKDYTPQEVFGAVPNAKGQRFIVLTLQNVPEAKWNADVYVRPYWTTYDGVKVYGLGKYVYVQDGIDGWISVPVSLHSCDAIAAGMLNVGFDSQNLEYKGYRAGRVFEEMSANVEGSTIKCVGNVSEVANATADDMYITLRFKLINNYEVANGETFLKFAVDNINFANIDETFVPMNVMNIQY